MIILIVIIITGDSLSTMRYGVGLTNFSYDVTHKLYLLAAQQLLVTLPISCHLTSLKLLLSYARLSKDRPKAQGTRY